MLWESLYVVGGGGLAGRLAAFLSQGAWRRLLGESLSTAAVVALAVVCFGVVASTRAPSSHGRLTAAAIAFGLLGSVSFGSTFVLGGHAAALGVAWTLLCSRATGVVAMTPFALARRTPLPRGSLRILALMAIGDVGGYGFLLLGAADSIAIASVIASQYALIAVVLSRFAFHERLSRFQAVGIALTMVGVAAVSLVGAS